NSDRGTEGEAPVDEANPRAENRDGHVIELDELDDATSTEFGWRILLLCGDPEQNETTYFSGFPPEQVSPISCPDNLAFDSVGNLWISTDGQPGGIGKNDGLFRVTLEGEARGRVEQFLSVPRDAETCGPVIRDEDRTAFVAVQHPGENGEWGAHTSFFPEYEQTGPKPCIVQVLPALAEPDPEPEPTPDPDPEPAPDPEPTPDPDPAPSLAPEPTPEPSPTTAPQPSDGGGAGGDTGTGTGTGGGPGGDTGGGPSTGDHSDRGDRGDLARTGVGARAPAAVAAGLLGAGGALVASRRRAGADAPAAGEEPAQSP